MLIAFDLSPPDIQFVFYISNEVMNFKKYNILFSEIGDECTNKNGVVGFCQLKNKCTKDTDLGATCKSEPTIICCAKQYLNYQKDNQLPQSQFGYFPSFFHAPIPFQDQITNNDFINYQKQNDHKLIGNVSPQNVDTKITFVEDRPQQYFEQDVITELLNNNNNQNLNTDNVDSDQTIRKNKTQNPNQNGNSKYTYYQITEKNVPNYITQKPNQNKKVTNNQKQNATYYNSTQNKMPNYYTSTQKSQINFNTGNNDNNSQFSSSLTGYNNYEENNKPINREPNYHTTASSILHNALTNNDFYFTTNPKQISIENEKRINERSKFKIKLIKIMMKIK